MIALWCILAFGEPTDEAPRPAATPWQVQQAYDAHRAARDLPPETLACQVLWPDVARLCLRQWVDGRRRWVSTNALAARGETLADLQTAFTEASAERLQNELERVPVDGFSQSYLRLRDGDGWAVAGALAPEHLARALGSSAILVALPSTGVLVAWAPGDAQFDQAMAVGVREIFDGSPDRVSPVVMRWDDGTWTAYAEAKPSAEAAPASKATAD